MLVINERDLPWAAGANPSLSLKNILTDYEIGPGKVSCGISRWAYGQGGQPHIHSDQDEIYIVLRGRGMANLAGELREMGPGDLFHAKAGEVHGMVQGLDPEGIEMFYALIPRQRDGKEV